MEDKYVFLIEQEGDNVKITYIDDPIIIALETTATTSTINVKVKVYNVKDEKYEYYIKPKASEENFKKEKTSTSNEYTYEGLEQGVTYLVKVVVKTKPNKETALTKEITLGEIAAGTEEGAIIFANPTWDADTHKASVQITTQTSYQIQYQINPTETTLTDNEQWTTIVSGNNITGLNLNDKLYARLWDGTNGGSPASTTITDGTKPTVTLTKGNVTTNSITVTASAVDNQAGMPDSPTYVFYVKQGTGSYTKEQTGASATFTKTGLTQGVAYTIKVEVQDKAGNTGSDEESITTGTMTGTVTIGSPTWNSSTHKASVKVSTTSAFKIQYQKNATETTLKDNTKWTEIASGSSVTGLSLGDTVYARLWDGTNGMSPSSKKVTDGTVPTVTLTETAKTTNSISVTASAVDNQAGMPDSPTYTFYIKETSAADSAYTQAQSGTKTTFTKSGLTHNVSYTIKVEVKDKAENKGTKTIDIKTGLVEGTVTIGSPTWNSSTHKASVKISTSAAFTLQYQKNPTTANLTDNTKWTTITSGTTISGLSLNDMIYARLWDGTNGTSPASKKVTDGTAPTAKITLSGTTEVTGETITATVEQSDAQSGITNFANCKWVYTTTSTALGTTDESKYSGGTFSKSPENISLTTNTAGTYFLHVLTKDAAGNKKETISSAITITTVKNASEVLTPGKYVAYTPTSQTFSMTTSQTGYSTSQSFKTSDYTGLWQVLYNDSTNGLQLISADSVGYLYLAGETGYNKSVETLNYFSRKYENSNFTVTNSGRIVGTNPANPVDPSTGNVTYVVNFEGSKDSGLKTGDTTYTTDYNKMYSLGIHNIGGHYWTASRKAYHDSEAASFSLYVVPSGADKVTELPYRRLVDKYAHTTTTSYEFEYAYGMRPIVKLKTTVKYIRGDGSSSNPYQIRAN